MFCIKVKEFSLVLLLKCFFLLNLLRTVNAACTFPEDLTGTWRSTRWDDLVFTSSQVTMPDFQGASLTFNCDSNVGTKYLIRSTTTRWILLNQVEVVACLDLVTPTAGVKYIYYHATTDISLPGGIDQPVRLVVPGTTITTSDTCTITSYSVGSNDVMINTSAVADAVVNCPIPLLANFDNYTLISYTGTTYCDGVGYIHICDDSRTVLAEYSICSDKVFYSDNGNLSCVHSSSSGSVYYANLLNNDASVDNVNYYHYTCVVIQTTGTIVYATQWPRKCHSTQTPTSIPSSVGYMFQMYTNLTCVPGGGGGGGAFSIIPIVVSILFIIIIAAATYYFCKKKKMYKKMPCYKKKGKKTNKVSASTKSINVWSHDKDPYNNGLQPTAVILPSDRSATVTPMERRNLETAQSTRSAITVSHMDAQIMEEQVPRRLPPLEPNTTVNILQESNTSETPSMTQRLPPISDSLLEANDTGGEGNLDSSKVSRKEDETNMTNLDTSKMSRKDEDISRPHVLQNMTQGQEIAATGVVEPGVPPESTQDNTLNPPFDPARPYDYGKVIKPEEEICREI